MNTNERTPENSDMTPDQLQSDLNSIKQVLSDSYNKNNIHRIIISISNFYMALQALVVALILIFLYVLAGRNDDTFNKLALGIMSLIIILIACICAFPFLFAGWGLLKGKLLGKVWAFISAFLLILNIPLGTGLAVYTFWALKQGKLEPKI